MGNPSIAKHEINAALARHLVSSQFPKFGDLAVEPIIPGGWDNRSFRLGTSMLIRLPSAEEYAAQVGKEQAWLPRLAASLPLPIPVPLEMGKPDAIYPWNWSIYHWVEGTPATPASVPDQGTFAEALAAFLARLHQCETRDAPVPGDHNFFRAGPLRTYDRESRESIARLAGTFEAKALGTLWEEALSSTWSGKAVWVHGDLAPENLLVRNGRLAAVIDFGCSAIGDPACDLAISWTFLRGEARTRFHDGLNLDEATWARGKGWALWKAMLVLLENRDSNPHKAQKAATVIQELLVP